MAKPIPDGYPTVIPTLAVDNAREAIEFYKKAFGAREKDVMEMPDGKIAHAELWFGKSIIMLSDPYPQASHQPPQKIGGTSVGIFLYVDNVDEVVKSAANAGGEVKMKPEDMFWGDRFGSVMDPWGHIWQIATHVEDVSRDEIQQRSRKAMASMN